MKKLLFSTFRRRLAVYLSVLALFVGGHLWRTWWLPDEVLVSEHYRLFHATEHPTAVEALHAVEALQLAYGDFFGLPVESSPRPRLPLVLHADREEFKRVHPYSRWAEAFYVPPVAVQYVDHTSEAPLFWLIHEATHQLNFRYLGVWLPRWANEGLACLFSTSRMHDGQLQLGEIHEDTYPVWWLGSMALTGDIGLDAEEGQIIRLGDLLGGEYPLSMNRHFNTYYLHWFSLVHYLAVEEEQQYRAGLIECLQLGCDEDQFEVSIGPVEEVEAGWYSYLQQINGERRARSLLAGAR